ncbi:hypothetical protein H8356DRAFT_1417666 [Neocallimastix lanati (nom. inval.)]|nr:hypothetical protein H8356DRAFT_1417666 [Neocallimastix sp. JGI-2020a]
MVFIIILKEYLTSLAPLLPSNVLLISYFLSWSTSLDSGVSNGHGADKFIRDTCKSKICTNSTIEVCKKMTMDKLLAYENSPYTKGKFTYKELNSYKKIIEVLESEECKNENVTNKNINL